jgi:hypothetical protein|tara:strand:+ start:2560 stop:2982 length:423 start_codon:yes stop_codon:yes gene_type:complete
MGNKKRRDRVLRRKEALEAFSAHHGVVLNVLAEVIYDLSLEVSELKTVEQDQMYCAELLYRLENGARYGDEDLAPLNDYVIPFIAMAATNVWTMAARRDSSLRRARLPRVSASLHKDGGRIASGMSARMKKQAHVLRFRL